MTTSEENRRYYEKRWSELQEFLGGKCNYCGTIENLEIDHIDSDQKNFDLRVAWRATPTQVLLDEAAKCQLLCHDCHVEKSKVEGDFAKGNPVWSHGTSSYGWMKKGCDCFLCEEAHVQWNEKRRLQRQALPKPEALIRGSYSPRGVIWEHGDVRRYRQGCKCTKCRAAKTAYEKELRQSKRTYPNLEEEQR